MFCAIEVVDDTVTLVADAGDVTVVTIVAAAVACILGAALVAVTA